MPQPAMDVVEPEHELRNWNWVMQRDEHPSRRNQNPSPPSIVRIDLKPFEAFWRNTLDVLDENRIFALDKKDNASEDMDSLILQNILSSYLRINGPKVLETDDSPLNWVAVVREIQALEKCCTDDGPPVWRGAVDGYTAELSEQQMQGVGMFKNMKFPTEKDCQKEREKLREVREKLMSEWEPICERVRETLAQLTKREAALNREILHHGGTTPTREVPRPAEPAVQPPTNPDTLAPEPDGAGNGQTGGDPAPDDAAGSVSDSVPMELDSSPAPGPSITTGGSSRGNVRGKRSPDGPYWTIHNHRWLLQGKRQGKRSPDGPYWTIHNHRWLLQRKGQGKS
ncbi:hypothetical protein N7468_000995 [Penicillium chermesinum]|uniref:Uncharacterized protein n=1 Tax=Penicillium chermesinum TaxID=63820 RepID=A0A9W9PIS1_9EURO|nr:uncharacterized protein N7468_000995 [Penicillium chermesinum]KAJ5246012.1 hypothetical protein N7468_000995 [Penicillium chermesinum]